MMVAAFIILAGCTSLSSKQRVKDYATQAVSVHHALASVYRSAEQARVDAILSRAVRDGIPASDLAITAIEHSGQQQALTDLTRYANLLYALASDGHNARIDQEAEQLHDTLTSLTDNPFVRDIGGIEEADISIVSTGINALGRALTETSRHRQLRAVMEAGQPVIQQTIARLRQDLPHWQMATRVALNQALSIRMQLLNNPNRCQQSHETRCVTLHTSYDQRLKAYHHGYLIKQKLLGLEAHFARLDLALSDYVVMHDAIIASLTLDNTASRQGARRAIATTKRHLDALKDFQKPLEE
ncbi:hypothetical protein [Salinivibrio sp. ES.052]|uniref:hypothetical protein n=1 Tax=Salinivibrio sp. ES.052 TaxID=1882823 RepID=UPI00092B3119|nr:hypothetical protein [Salinivibrio sp. ES.052]SIN83355.1 hypothetical protein SAMN05444724_0781 [Salinivibrio sp. ES.052]